MASRQSTVNFIVEQIAGAGVVSAKKMFGEYGVFCDGKMVALICDDQLFVKPIASGREYIGNALEDSPYQGAKPCFVITEDKWNNNGWLTKLIQITAAALPLPQKKTRKTSNR